MDSKNSVIESFATLTLGLWSVCLIGYLHSGIDWTVILLIVVGSLSALFAMYIILPDKIGQGVVLAYFKKNNLLKIAKSLGWLIVVLLFGVALVQSEVLWLIIVGLITMIVTFVAFYISLWKI
jgi:hypothetical protein